MINKADRRCAALQIFARPLCLTSLGSWGEKLGCELHV